MKADYIVEQPFGRRRSRGRLRLVLAAILLPVSLAAIILSYQNANAEHDAGTDAGGTTVHVIALPQSAPVESTTAADAPLSPPASDNVDSAPTADDTVP